MKRYWIFLMGLATAAAAQQPLPESPALTDKQQVQAQRAKWGAEFDQQETECYKKFATNHCLAQVREKRREVMADLRRQEVILNDEERRKRAAAQVQAMEEKNSPAYQQKQAERRQGIQQALKNRQERSIKKAQEGTQLQPNRSASIPLSSDKEKQARDKAQRDKAAAHLQQYEEKQRQAQEHKAKVEKKRLEQQDLPLRSLPVPLL